MYHITREHWNINITNEPSWRFYQVVVFSKVARGGGDPSMLHFSSVVHHSFGLIKAERGLQSPAVEKRMNVLDMYQIVQSHCWFQYSSTDW